MGVVTPTRRCSAALVRRSDLGIYVCPRDFKSWMESLPAAWEVRPATCPCCAGPSQPVGQRICLVGHGIVERTVWGPIGARGAPGRTAILIRRYLCLHCGTVVRVGPRGLAYRRRYGLGAIAAALVLSFLGDSSLTVGQRHAAAREVVGPDRIVAFDSQTRWRSLGRWARAVQQQSLFEDVLQPFGLQEMGLGAVVHRLGQALLVHAPEADGAELEVWTAFEAAHREGWVV